MNLKLCVRFSLLTRLADTYLSSIIYPIVLCEYIESIVTGATEKQFYLFIDEVQLTTKVVDKENGNIEVTIYDMLNDILNFLASQISSLTNPANIANAIASMKNEKVNPALVSNYVQDIVDSFLISVAKRYDVKGKTYLTIRTSITIPTSVFGMRA